VTGRKSNTAVGALRLLDGARRVAAVAVAAKEIDAIAVATEAFATTMRRATISKAARRTEHAMSGTLRSAIDAATPVGISDDAHPTAYAMVAEDARQERRMDDAITALAQIPPVRIGRSTYRVIAEDVVNGQRKIALLCRTRPSTLAQHSACDCILCGFVQSLCDDHAIDPFCRWGDVEVWHHDKTDSYHLRHIKTGAFRELPKGIRFRAHSWLFDKSGCQPAWTTSADGRLY